MEKTESAQRFILQVLHSMYLNRVHSKNTFVTPFTAVIALDDKTLFKLTTQMASHCNIVIHQDNPNTIHQVYQNSIRVQDGYKKRISKVKNTPICICVMPYSNYDPDAERTKNIITKVSKKETLILLSSTEVQTDFDSQMLKALYDPEISTSKLNTVAKAILQQTPELTPNKVKILLVPDTHLALHDAEQYIVPSDYESLLQVLMLHDLVKNHAAEGPFLTFETPYELELKIDGAAFKLNINDEYTKCNVLVLDSPLNCSREDRSMFQDLLKKLFVEHGGKNLIVACSTSSMQRVIKDLAASTNEDMVMVKAAVHLGMLYGLVCQLIHFVKDAQ